MTLNTRLDALQLGGIRRITEVAKKQPGCILLTLGEPEFDTPKPIREAAQAALDRGFTHYTANAGDLGLREAISRFEAEKRGLSYGADEILVTLGATEAIYTAMTGVLNPGDEVLIPTPAFSLYDTVAKMAGATVVPLSTEADGFQLTAQNLKAHLTEKSKLLILNSPNNPTGVIYSRENLLEIAQLVEETGLFVLCDDVYWGLSPCFGLAQIPELKPQVLAVQSFSKPYAMTGWRMGYLMAEKSVLQKLTVLHGHCVTCAPAMLQEACKTALSCDPGPMAEAYRTRREYICQRLSAMGLPCVRPQGAFYVFPAVSSFCADDWEFCMRMIREAGVASVPGSVFAAPGHLRMSYCCSDADLKTAMDRLEGWLTHLKGM